MRHRLGHSVNMHRFVLCCFIEIKQSEMLQKWEASSQKYTYIYIGTELSLYRVYYSIILLQFSCPPAAGRKVRCVLVVHRMGRVLWSADKGSKGSGSICLFIKKQKKQTWKSGFSFHSTTGFQLDSCCEVWSSESTLTFFQWTALFVELLFQRSTSTNTWTAAWAERKRRTASGGRRGLRTRVCSWVPLHCRTEQQ